MNHGRIDTVIGVDSQLQAQKDVLGNKFKSGVPSQGQLEFSKIPPYIPPKVTPEEESLLPQEQRFWLNKDAPTNMELMAVTLLTCHNDTSMLNEDASSNIANMFITFPTFHNDTSLLNDDAWKNILSMSVTFPTFHKDTSLLNEFA